MNKTKSRKKLFTINWSCVFLIPPHWKKSSNLTFNSKMTHDSNILCSSHAQLTLMEKIFTLSWRVAKVFVIWCMTILYIVRTSVDKDHNKAFTTGNASTIARSVVVDVWRPLEINFMSRIAMVREGEFAAWIFRIFYDFILMSHNFNFFSSAQSRDGGW